MFILRAIPIKKGLPSEFLSYYSPTSVSPGMIIDIPVRSGSAPGLVVESIPIEESKGAVKNLPFSLRKLIPKDPVLLFAPHMMRAFEKIAHHHATSLGIAIEALTLKLMLTERQTLSVPPPSSEPESSYQGLIFQADDETRLAHYKSLIREAFAKKHSLFICVPTVSEGERLFSYLQKGIEHYAHFIHGAENKKELLHTWNEVITSTHPLLVIATPTFLTLPRRFETIIIERESSRHYKMRDRPYIDMRTFAELYAKESKAICIFADSLCRLETLHRLENLELSELGTIKWRSTALATLELIDMRHYNKEEKEFRLLGDELLHLIEKTKERAGHIFLYVSRRGHSSSIVCRDCGTSVLCGRCHTPVVLHASASKDSRFFLCHTCGEKRDADETCRHCESWNLVPLGIGIEHVEELLRERFPEMHVFRIDRDATSTALKAKKLFEQFKETPGSILIGTDMALFAIDEPLEYTAIVSLDSLFSLPDFRIHEKIFHTILRLRSLSTNHMIAQTRQADSPIWQEALTGNSIDFYRREIKEREELRYPPFSTLIKISYAGTPEKVRAEMKRLKLHLKEYELSLFPAFIETKKGKFMMHALLRQGHKEWPQDSLLMKLRELPPDYSINVDPENLL